MNRKWKLCSGTNESGQRSPTHIKFIHGVVIGGCVLAIIRPPKIVQYLEPFAIDGIEKVVIVRMNLMDERHLLAFCNEG